MQDELLEAFRNPYLLISFVSVLSFCVTGSAQVTDAVQVEFKAYRLQQLEMGGTFAGSRNARMSFDAVTLDGNTLRKCIVVDWLTLVGRDLDGILSSSAGALLIVIPFDIKTLNSEQRKSFADLERALLAVRTDLPVFVVQSNAETAALLEDAASTSASSTASVISSLASPTTLLSTTSSPSATALNYQPNNVVARLSSGDRTAPTIAFVAHYDTHSAFPGLSPGSDSNGSGVVALLELLAILKKFYDKPSTRPPYNLDFLWSAAGKLNFQGARQFAEQWQDKNPESKLELAICVEGIGGKGSLYYHVAKIPNEGSAAERFLQRLRATQNIEIVAKKISVNQLLSWEHERFNIKRLAAVTVSRYPSHEEHIRHSLLDTPEQIDKEQLNNAIRSLAEAVLGYLLNLKGGVASDNRVEADYTMLSKQAVNSERIDFFMSQLTNGGRSAADQENTKAVASNIAAAAGAYAKVTQQGVLLSEISIWAGISDSIVAERVRPAAFELFVAAGVISYLAVFYQLSNVALSVLEGSEMLGQTSLALCRGSNRHLQVLRTLKQTAKRCDDLKTPIQQWGWEYLLRQRALKRPLSPNLGIYKIQLTMGMSGMHRVTGCVMAGAMLFGSVGFAVAPFNFTQFIDYIRGWNLPAFVTGTFKWIIAFPIVYHSLNGIRHMSFDMARGIDLPSIYKSGYLVMALSVLITTLIVAKALQLGRDESAVWGMATEEEPSRRLVEYDYEEPRLHIKGFVVDYFAWRISQAGHEWYEQPELPFGVQPEHQMMRQVATLFERRQAKDFEELFKDLLKDGEDLAFPRYCQVIDTLTRADPDDKAMSYGRVIGLISFGGALATRFAEMNKRNEIFKMANYTSKYIDLRIRLTWAKDGRSWSDFMRTSLEALERGEKGEMSFVMTTRLGLMLTAGAIAVLGLLFSSKFIFAKH
ncbi:unnamed protein product, partial [Mesorhabditis belari]|uniref:BOS complex subunit NCLN n=1 Tax=Mesorhabditis belari TaxID=2138241 RepID=A0AAF3F3M6_9BILA